MNADANKGYTAAGRRRHMSWAPLLRLACLAVVLPAVFAAASASPLTLEIRDFVELPITGKLDGKGQTDGMLARVNALREEPGGANRLFVHDLNGPLYILDKATRSSRSISTSTAARVTPVCSTSFAFETGYANGLVSFQFDPDYRRNGRFYTVHIEDPSVDAPACPTTAALPGLERQRLRATRPIATPGETQREGVLIEWTDTNICEHDVRRVRPRAAAGAAEHPHPPARRRDLQPGRAARRRRLAGALHRLRRRRLGRVAPRRSARTRSGSIRSSGKSCASCPI